MKSKRQEMDSNNNNHIEPIRIETENMNNLK